ncbi:Nucleolar GTP-binding protein 1 [Bienertia sinuspersici]
MADRLLDENARDGNIELLYVNRAALSSAFERTLNRLYNALNNVAQCHADQANNQGGPWSMRVIRKLPLGTYITAYMKGGISAVFPALQASMWELQKRRSLLSDDGDEFAGSDDQSAEVVGAEKLAQELLWIIHKLRACHGVDEALVQWSLASNLSSLALNANPRQRFFSEV